MTSKPTHINVQLNADSNRQLEESCAHNYRSKRKEAGLRLKDHLKRFGKNWHQAADKNDDSTPS